MVDRKPSQQSQDKKRSRVGRTPRFSKEVIVETALKIIDRDGYQAFSMRTLAAEMGIAVMTLYVYVPTREEIVSEIGKVLLGKLGSAQGPEASWDSRIECYIRDLYEVIKLHPGAIDIFVAELSILPATDRITDHVRESLLGIMLTNGFSIRDSTDVVSALIDYVIGHAIVHRNYELRSRVGMAKASTSSISRRKYPYIVKVAAKYTPRWSRRAFDFGLSILLDGIRDHLRPG